MCKKAKDEITDYIKSILPSDFSKVKYVEGFYVTYDYDTVYTFISKFRDSEKNNAIFIAKDDSSNYEIYTAINIRSYSFEDNCYLSYFPSMKNNKKIYLFIRKGISGNINLYEKPDIPYHRGSYYLVNRNGTDVFYNVCPDVSCTPNERDGYNKMVIPGSSYHETGTAYVPTKPDLNNSFKELMPQLVHDCVMVANKIKAEFYTKRDILQIVKEYNNCHNSSHQQ